MKKNKNLKLLRAWFSFLARYTRKKKSLWFPVTDYDPILVKFYLKLLFASPFQFPDVFNRDSYRIA